MEYLHRMRDKFTPQEVPYTHDVDEPGSEDNEYLITSSSKRSCTDVPFIIIQGCITIILLCLLGYCIANGDIQRLTNGYDNCGNVCGKNNNFNVEGNTACKATDMTDKPFLYINNFDRTCVKNCTNNSIIVFGNRCLPENGNEGDKEAFLFMDTILGNFHFYSVEITYLALIAVVFSIFMLLVLRYMTAAFVWTSLIGSVIALAGATGYLVYLTNINIDYLRLTIVFAVITLVSAILIIVVRKRIPLVIQLFEESGKALADIPLLFFQPILTFITLAVVWCIWLSFTLWTASAGKVVVVDSQVTFEQNAVIQVAFWYNHIVMLWMVCFVYGCQNMLLAGAVSTWFFARNKTKLNSPIYNSAYNMIRYHLGTISFGSLILLLIRIVRIIFAIGRIVLRRLWHGFCYLLFYHFLESIVAYIERIVNILTRNAYAITAIYGYSFKESGKRAYELIVENVMSVLAINTVGTYVLRTAKVLIAAATISIMYLFNMNSNMYDSWPMIAIIGFIAYLIANCFVSLYEMAADTIFVCYCEDSMKNDGISRPYYMSEELMQFSEKCKNVVILKKGSVQIL